MKANVGDSDCDSRKWISLYMRISSSLNSLNSASFSLTPTRQGVSNVSLLLILSYTIFWIQISSSFLENITFRWCIGTSLVFIMMPSGARTLPFLVLIYMILFPFFTNSTQLQHFHSHRKLNSRERYSSSVSDRSIELGSNLSGKFPFTIFPSTTQVCMIKANVTAYRYSPKKTRYWYCLSHW